MRETLTREHINAKKILDCKNCENSELLLDKKRNQAAISNLTCCTLKKDGYIFLDFGREIHGGINIVVHKTKDEQSGKLRVVFGESVSEALSKIGEKNATNNHSLRDITVEVPFLSNNEIGKTGFRFVKIEALTEYVEIKSVTAIFIYKDIEYKGDFECDNVLLNDIWKTGAYTVHLNMQDYLWDGIKRDRLVWIGDMHPETSIISSVFGYDDCVPRSLDLTRDETPVSDWMCGMPTYSMWWLKIHRDWYYQNGDINYLKEQQDYIFELLKKLFELINDDGTNKIDYKFVDWSSFETDAADSGVHAMLTLSMNTGKELCEILENTELASECQKNLSKLKNYSPSYVDNKQMAALMAYSGAGDIKEIYEFLKREPLKGLSTFLGFYVLNVYAMSGDIDGAFNVIENYWGRMFEFGATTFWEDFDVEWAENAYGIDEFPKDEKSDIHGDNGKYCYTGFRHSLCHGWAGGPTAFLSRYVLGVEILEPGCKKIRINPMLGKLNWVKGKYPTPYGEIEIEHKRENNEVVTRVTAPKEIEIITGERG